MTESRNSSGVSSRPYRFGFLLNTTIGNMTRYQNLRKYAEMDQEVSFHWAPVNHWTPPDFPSRLRFLPAPLFMRARLLQQSWPVLSKLGELDAVMTHLYEGDLLCTLRKYISRQPLLVSSTDEAPIVDRAHYPLYPSDLRKPVWRQKMRLAIDMWRVRHADLFIPLSNWAADILVRHCHAPPERVYPLHVGMDLDLWGGAPSPAVSLPAKPLILFVGGDFDRKGGALLLEVFEKNFSDRAELHLVTRQAPTQLPAGVHVHANFNVNDKGLPELYSRASMVVVPTTADTGPLWVFMEAMAMRVPIIGTDTGSNTELIRHGETGFVVKIGDRADLTRAIETLLKDPALGQRMGAAGRALIERQFNAAVNVPKILRFMKDAVDLRRASASGD